MVIIMSPHATCAEIESVIDIIHRDGYQTHRSAGQSRTIIGVIGTSIDLDPRDFELMNGVTEAVRVTEPYKLAGRTFKPESTIVEASGVAFGGNTIPIIAGPCSVENREQIIMVAGLVAEAGAKGLRGGAYKPRTSPYSFQGLGEKGLQLLREAADEFDLIAVTEVLESGRIGLVSQYADILQLGARNMHNFTFLRELGEQQKPVLLKRGISATIEEWLQAAEYILAGGNSKIILCERGIRTFETYTRNTMDISAIPVIHKLSHLPIIADPSHGTGRRDKVLPMARASIAAGADGLMVEVHSDPDNARSDGAQSLRPEQFEILMSEIRQMAAVLDRSI